MSLFVLCPECQRKVNLNDDFNDKLVRDTRIQCSAGHKFTIFDGLISLGLQPDHYNIFWPIHGMETGQVRIQVGQWIIIKPKKPFEEIDEVQTIFFSEEDSIELSNVRTEARFRRDNPSEFCLMICGEKEDWGKVIIMDWIVYGTIKDTELEVWRENLTYAARQLLAANYRPSIIQSAVAVESFVYDNVINYLKKSKWDPKNIKDYVEGSSIDSLSVQGLIRIFIQEIMGVIIQKEVFDGWIRLKRMRDSLAHGDLKRYRTLTDASGQSFLDDKSRAEFAYQSAVRFIYDVRYPRIRGKA